LSEAGSAEVFGRRPPVATCGGFAPLGRGTREEGTGAYRISGRWPWVSGSMHSEYRLGGFVVPIPGGGAEVLHAFFHRDETRMLDTWYTAGLGGTGSHDMEVEDAVIPESRVIRFLGGTPRERGPLYRFPAFGLLATGVAAVSLGIARDALDTFIDLAKAKRTQGGKRTIADRETIQVHVARARALVESGRAYLHATVDAAYAKAAAGGEIDADERATIRLAATHATANAEAAVDILYRAAGGTAVFDTCKLQKHLRDVHVATAHAMVAEPSYGLVGRLSLGLETDTSQL
jgi:alkylation response protein AidB-like acyl-CoA dehydrogenase